MGKGLGKDYCYSSWDDFREWAEGQNWYMVIYDSEHPIFITPTGTVVQVQVGEDEYVKSVIRQKGG